ncbi:hypothetical protein BDQ12DRAFT_238181 [Crucibulum laeve]|uniref:MARVEL domain-containing protein n=1 Tax=Crucibulum laeve TaxID=68775 RepID=A0A5C3LV71_9AGAR|nr:hypothetical protein BDQ12DRAFT_238181 [Crucibulum laeve]
MGNFIYYTRNLVLCLSFIFAITVLGLSASWINVTDKAIVTNFEVLPLITSLLTVVLAPIWLIIGQLRKNATFTRIATELCLIFVLWSLWLSSGALVASWSNLLFPSKCTGSTFSTESTGGLS